LFFEFAPEVISIELRGTRSIRANVLISSSFAAPSTGGAAMRMRKRPSCSPAISLREARDTTRTLNVIVPSFSE
jgi:hypothetical protein